MCWRRGTEPFVRLLRSFAYAASGMGRCLLEEQNFRLQLTAAACALLLGRWMPLGPAEWALLWLTIGMVLGFELMNTAVEAAVDLFCSSRHPLAKLAKDCAAGAALAAALASIAVGWHLFWRVERLSALASWLTSAPLRLLLCGLALLLALWFVFIGPASLLGERRLVRLPPAERNKNV